MGPRLTLKLYFHYKGLSNIITLLLPRLSTDHLSLSTSETMSMRTNMNIQTCSTEFCETVMTIKQHIMRRVAQNVLQLRALSLHHGNYPNGKDWRSLHQDGRERQKT